MRPEPDSPYLTDASGLRGCAADVLIPDSEAALSKILREASASNIAVTISGAGTGVTGGRVPDGGWLVSLEKLNGTSVGKGYAVCGAGASLAAIQTAAAPTKQFYAPDPTETSASIGGTAATNASGSRSFLYGDTRRHIRALRVVLASGEVLALRRGEKPPFEIPALPAPDVKKNTAGYFMRPGFDGKAMDFLDLFIGAEGTLGVISEVEIALLPVPKNLFTGVVFFDSDNSALDAVDAWRPVAGLRMLEYADAASLNVVRGRFPEIPARARVAIMIEQDLGEGDGAENVEEAWLDRLEASHAFTDDSWFAASSNDRERFRRFRHAVPEAVNDTVRERGLMKVNSDFAVPLARNRENLHLYRETLDRQFPGQYVIFGHIGDAHVHINVLPANQEQMERAMGLMKNFAAAAVGMGGTVSAEHGLGKRKRDYLKLQFTPEQIEQMRAVKRRLDPHWILGRGTLFEYPVFAPPV
jgi:FAD/FMN-containing dehydrogenase